MSGTTHHSIPGAWFPKVALAGVWAAASLAHFLAPPELRLRTWPAAYGLLEVLACASLLNRAVQARGRERAAWGLLAASTLMDALNLSLTLFGIGGSRQASLLNLATGLLAVSGLLAFPRGPERRGRRVVDSLIFATSLLLLLWVMGVQASLRAAAQGMGLRVFLAYLNAALLGGGVVYLTSGRPGGARGAHGWLAMSALAWTASLACWSLAGLPSQVNSQVWIVLAGGIPLCQGLAAWSSWSLERTEPRAVPTWSFFRFFPYLPMAAGIVALSWLLALRPGAVTRETFAIFLVLVIFLVLRMLQAIKDLQSANSSLEERVSQRTRDLVKAQETLIRTERMNTMATLGAGLTHDLNNFLGAIRTSADLMQANLDRGQPVSARELRRILEISEKASRSTQRLMNFGRRGMGQPGGTTRDIADALGATRPLLRMLLPDTISLVMELDPATCPVLVESATLEQVLVNLVSNAKDAMPGGGEVTIRLRAGTLPGGGPAAVLEVQDTGCGIPPEEQEAIFAPFFTTKTEGRGTGLGLASVRALMEAQSGTVDVVSFPGQGTTFRLAFPGFG